MTVTANTEDTTKAAGPKKGKKVTAQTAEETKTEGTPDQETQKTEDENQNLDEHAAGDAVQKNDGPEETKTEGTPDQEAQKTEDENQNLDESLGENASKDSKQVPDQQIQLAAIQQDMPPEIDETKALEPLELAVLNHGSNTHCNVSRTNLPQNERVVIKYKSLGAKKQAQMNFAQLNALAGKARFEVEG
ncbi:hypothetical protein [Acinetobacter seifertii]|uniref:hypothetical protein n=1 Tax=Acinetobacter seifertii TaxID=1530123 RepID=UPI001908AEE3|nr:hypothetical protein [Acinetobacter seifertii]MBJ9425222.1 hypothetical protein [Acinetobacter seifertii]